MLATAEDTAHIIKQLKKFLSCGNPQHFKYISKTPRSSWLTDTYQHNKLLAAHLKTLENYYTTETKQNTERSSLI